ncbi:Uncharacterized protein T08_4279 [Trichinella sp. T8]|nr:Uncharacterized protein T08_4279 [Trichinella sp. T8]
MTDQHKIGCQKNNLKNSTRQETLRRKILKVLHEGRPGIAAMKAFTRYYIWWLNCDRDIQTFVEKCYPCQGNPENVLDQPLFSWNAPSKPWT